MRSLPRLPDLIFTTPSSYHEQWANIALAKTLTGAKSRQNSTIRFENIFLPSLP